MILGALTSEMRPRNKMRPKLVAKTSKKAEKGAWNRPTKIHARTNIETTVNNAPTRDAYRLRRFYF